MFKFIKSTINEKKILRNQIKLTNKINDSLLDANKKQQEDIVKLQSKLKKLEETREIDLIFMSNLEGTQKDIVEYAEKLRLKVKKLELKSAEDNKTINEKNEIIESQDYTIEIYEDRNKQLLSHNEKLKKKSDRQEKRALKLKVELSESQKINTELIKRVTVSEIAKYQLKELCKYKDNNSKEADKVKRPGVLVNKYVSGVKVYELANLM